MQISSLSLRDSLKIALTYLAVSALWIFFSDRLLGLFTNDGALLLELQTYKGWFFVLITSVLLYYLIEKSTSRLVKSRNKIEQALDEKQVVLSELHHRVKNNLAIICGLIDLQADELEGVKETRALKTIQHRIYTLAEIEELFYQNRDMSRVPFHEYMNHLISSLNNMREGKRFDVNADIENLDLNISQAVPLGLLTNEIFSQLKLNGHTREVNSIEISFEVDDLQEISLSVIIKNCPPLLISRLTGNEQVEAILINLFTEQLHGSSEWKQDSGALEFFLSFNKTADNPSSFLTDELASSRSAD